jgi:CRISPR-associated protein (TIGR02710 family)
VIVSKANAEGLGLDAGRYQCFELPDGQDLERCLDQLRHLTPEVHAWLARNAEHRVVVDYTGGTKCMSAAIALRARQWPCLYSYVGGSDRTREGLGIVVTGTERVIHQANPWNELGSQAVEAYIMLFDQLGFAAAARVADEAKRLMSREDRKSELNVLEQLACAFDAWERFDHRRAASVPQQLAAHRSGRPGQHDQRDRPTPRSTCIVRSLCVAWCLLPAETGSSRHRCCRTSR